MSENEVTSLGGLVDEARRLSVGKHLPTAVYVHLTLLSELPQRVRTVAYELIDRHRTAGDWNVVKFSTREARISLLEYGRFDEDAFPILRRSMTIDLASSEARLRTYPSNDSALILHRKELLVPQDYVLREEFEQTTRELEQTGIFEDARSIGRLGEWTQRLSSVGYELIDGRVLRSDLFKGPAGWDAQRGRTAIWRAGPSLPLQTMQQHGWLDGRYSLLDYGCGRGDDLSVLEEIGVPAWGWDPAHRPDGSRDAADLVNLGYVVNVIEDSEERKAVLVSAFRLARKALVVSGLVAPPAHFERFLPFRDGVVTSRATFQKYFTQTELKEYVEAAVGQEAFGLATGVVVVFRDHAMREAFLDARYRRRGIYSGLPGGRRKRADRSKAATIYREHAELCDQLWETALELGRWPEPDEFARQEEIAALFGSLRRAAHGFKRLFDFAELDLRAQEHREDLLVSEAVAIFRRQERRVSDFPLVRQRELKHLFGSYRALREGVLDLLSRAADLDVLNEAAAACDRRMCGGNWDPEGVSFEARCIPRLPVVLRCYVELAAAYHGGLEGIDLVRVHLRSGKVTLSAYDDFYGKALPLMTSRTKIDLRNQRIEDYEYGSDFASPPLFWKSRFLAEDAPNREKQIRFDARLDDLGLAPDGDPRFGFSAATVDEILTAKGLEVRGFRFYRLR